MKDQLVQALGELFVARRDVYAEGYPRPNNPEKFTYAKQDAELTDALLLKHMKGETCVGIYQMAPDSTVKWFAIDFDAPKDDTASDALQAAHNQVEVLQRAGLHVHIERSRSGKGYHVWGFLSEPMSAALVRRALRPLMVDDATFDRLYPVQDGVSDGKPYGNLIMLPFYGRAVPQGGAVFVDAAGEPINPRVWLGSPIRTNPPAVLQLLAAKAPKERQIAERSEHSGAVADYPTVSGALKVVSEYGCQFLHNCFTDRATIREPQWHAGIQIATQFDQGRDFAHLLSMGHPGYSADEVDAKFDQSLQNHKIGCAWIHENYPKLACKQCPTNIKGELTAPHHLAKLSTIEIMRSGRVQMRRAGSFKTDLQRVKRYDSGELLAGLRWQFGGLDTVTRLRNKEMIVIGGAPSLGKCVKWDTLLTLPDTGERITVQEFAARRETKVVALDAQNRQVRATVGAYLADGVKPVFRVTTASGRRVEITAPHPLLTPIGWRPLAELTVGDHIAVPTAMPIEGTSPMDPHELAYLALMIAEGHCPSLTFTNTDVDLIGRFYEATDGIGCVGVSQRDISFYPLSGTVGQHSRATAGTTHPARKLLEAHDCMTLAGDKRIPARVWQVPNDQLAEFVGLLWSCDGYIGSVFAEFGVASEGLARDMVHALLRLGITSRLSFKENGKQGAWIVGIRDAASLHRFIGAVPLYGGRSQQAAAVRRAVGRTVGNLPAEQYPELDAHFPEYVTDAHNRRVRVRSGSGYIRMQALAALADDPIAQRLAAPDVFWDRIKEITYTGDHEVYDLCVPDYENFVAADVYVHNTYLMTDAAYRLSASGVPVFVFSAETGEESLRQRLLGRAAEVDTRALRGERDGIRLTPGEWRRLDTAAAELEALPLYLNFTAQTADDVLLLVEQALLLDRVPLDQPYVVFFDYLQYGPRISGEETDTERIARLSSEFKAVAKLLSRPVVVFSQLVREAEGEDTPKLTWFGGSRRIEQDLDVGIIITGERMSGDFAPRSLWIVKQREGMVSKIDMILRQTFGRWDEVGGQLAEREPALLGAA